MLVLKADMERRAEELAKQMSVAETVNDQLTYLKSALADGFALDPVPVLTMLRMYWIDFSGKTGTEFDGLVRGKGLCAEAVDE